MPIQSLQQYLQICDRGFQMKIGKGAGELTPLDEASMLAKDVQFAPDGKSASIVWKGHREYGAEFEVKADWKDVDGRYAGHISFRNYQGADSIEEIHFPVFRSPVTQESRFFQATWDMGFMRDMGEFKPGSTQINEVKSMQFGAVLVPEGQSVYFDWRDSSWTLKMFSIERAEDASWLGVSGIYLMPLGDTPEKEGCVPYECSVQFYQGGWYEASQIYKPWATRQTWWTSKEGQDNPLKDIGIWLWNRGLIQEVIPSVERLQEELPGIRVALDWYWWHSNPYDTDYPNFWPPREGEEAFRKAIEGLNRRGIYSQVYVNGVCWDHDTYNWNEGGGDGVLVHRNGNFREYAFNQYNHHRLAWQCGEAPAHREKLSQVVAHLHESGLTGQYLDMIGCATYEPCYSKKHKHAKGGGTYIVDGYRDFVRRLRQQHPGYAFTTECANEAYMAEFDGGIICSCASSEHLGNRAEIVPAFSAVYHGRFACFGNYAHPDGIPPWDPLWPAEDRWQHEQDWSSLYPDQFFVEMARNVIWGTQPMACHVRPEVLDSPKYRQEHQFILDTARFYYANRDFLYSGDMLNPKGFTCKERKVDFLARMIFTKEVNACVISKVLPSILHSVWCAADGRKALFLANYTSESQEWAYGNRSGSLAARSYQRVDL